MTTANNDEMKHSNDHVSGASSKSDNSDNQTEEEDEDEKENSVNELLDDENMRVRRQRK